jgi:cytochrome c553
MQALSKTLAALAGASALAWAASAASPAAPSSAGPPLQEPDPSAATRLLAQAPAPALETPEQLAEFFETRVRPIFVSRCEECHGESEDGGLRVDSREGLMKGGESGVAILAGDPDGSLLIQAVRHTHDKLAMPKKRAKLPDGEIEALAQWVRAGALWPDAAHAPSPAASPRKEILPEHRAFWSFLPLAHPAVPAVKDAAWPKGDIDRFVLAKLESEGLAPVAPADRRTLIRRATFDLTGLPPTPEEVEAFASDPDAQAFAKVVDRLLESPSYGEAWGRWWLDVARYGEDDCRSLDPEGRGYNPYPRAYLYRDWVVQALNDDLPYDQFVTAQLAADLAPAQPASAEPQRARNLPALGFLGLGPWYYDNGSVEVTRADERNDRVDTVTRGFLGLTVACARCHDHKYDPIRTEDYYALAGVFLNTRYKEYPRAPRSIVEEWNASEKKLQKLEKLLGEFQSTEAKQLSQTLALQSSKYMRAAWKVLGEPKQDKARVAGEEKLDYELFDRWLAFLVKPPKHYPYLAAWQEMIARGGSKEEAAKLADAFQEQVLEILFERKELEEENDVIRAKALAGTKKKEPAKLPSDFVTNDDFCPGCGLELKSLPIEKGNLWTDAFERDLDSDLGLAQKKEPPKPGLFAFRGWGLERQLAADRRRYLDDLRAQIAKSRKALGPKYPFAHGVEDAREPAAIRVHLRGSPFKLGDEVPRRFLEVLSPEPSCFGAGSGRLELAQALLRQPIAMRVIVNRVWKQHFGTGIVDTPSNFGQNGERPTNPELLEHLAQRFVDGGLSLKALHREILLSAVYQLSADDSPVARAKDSGNRLYWRANTRRLTAEQIRDGLLFVAGALDTKVGGPSEKLTPLAKRRTLYGKVSRYKLDEFLALFDFPAPNATCEKRFATNVPLQRLFFMNSDFVQQQAERLAERAAGEPDERAKVAKLYALAFARAPTPEEVEAGLAYLRSEPMKEYEERKAAREAELAAIADKEGKDAKEGMAGAPKPEAPAAQAKPDGPPEPPEPNGPGEDPDDGESGAADEPPGMMAGVVPDGAAAKRDAKLLPATVWGRYAKVLLSSNEFLFLR